MQITEKTLLSNEKFSTASGNHSKFHRQKDKVRIMDTARTIVASNDHPSSALLMLRLMVVIDIPRILAWETK